MIYINLYKNRTSSGFLTQEEAKEAAEPGCYGVLVFDDEGPLGLCTRPQ